MNKCSDICMHEQMFIAIVLGHQFTTEVMTQNVNEITQDIISGKRQNGKPNIC